MQKNKNWFQRGILQTKDLILAPWACKLFKFGRLCHADNFRHFIPANFFSLNGMRFLSFECQDFKKRHDYIRRFLKTSKDPRRFPRMFRIILKFSTKLLCSIWTFKNQRFGESTVIYFSFSDFSFLALVWVYIFLESVSVKAVMAYIFQPGVVNWSVRMSWREIKVFNPQAWDSHLRCESWQVVIDCKFKRTIVKQPTFLVILIKI